MISVIIYELGAIELQRTLVILLPLKMETCYQNYCYENARVSNLPQLDGPIHQLPLFETTCTQLDI